MANEIVKTIQETMHDCMHIQAFNNITDPETVLTSRLGRKSLTLAGYIRLLMDTGGFEPFQTETELKASRPTVTKKAAKAMDTKKIWYWNGTQWIDTGLSEKDAAISAAAEVALTNKGTVSTGAITDIKTVGTYYISTAQVTGLPEGFSDAGAYLTVTRHTNGYVYKLTGRSNPEVRWDQINVSGWRKTDVNASMTEYVPTVAVVNQGTLDSVDVGNIRSIGTWYVTSATGLPEDFTSTIKNVIIRNERFGSHYITTMYDRNNPKLQWIRINFGGFIRLPAYDDITSLQGQVVTSKGFVEGLALTTHNAIGTWYTTLPDELPEDFRSPQKAVVFRNERFGAHTVKYLQDRYRPEHIWSQLNNLGWVKMVTKPVRTEYYAYTQLDDKYEKFGVLNFVKKYSQLDWSILEKSNNELLPPNDPNRLEMLYGLYDDLITRYPDSVSRKSIGRDVTGLDIWEYTFKPVFIGKNASSPASWNKFPKCLVMCGHHGQETSGALAVALFFRQMMDNPRAEEIYMKARTHMEFRVIPTINPWGTKNNSRRNSANVDLNRNFPTGWDQADTGARGPSPLSELENQHALKWIQDNADAEVLLNAHDHGDPALAWGATAGFDWTHNALFNAFKELGMYYYNNFTKPESQKDIPVTWLGATVDGGLDKHCGQTLKFPTILYESPYINHPLLPSGQTGPRICSELILKSLIGQVIDRHKLKSIL